VVCDPKGGELCLHRTKPEEILVEVRKSIAKINATEKPNAGDTIINTIVFSVPENTIDSIPPETNAEPINPPTSA
jgi:hypothetical protein